MGMCKSWSLEGYTQGHTDPSGEKFTLYGVLWDVLLKKMALKSIFGRVVLYKHASSNRVFWKPVKENSPEKRFK